MDYIKPINQAIDYIENNLTEAITLEKISAAAGYSSFHFGRLFLALIGETPGEYLRKRRLSEAARTLVESRRKILDIALEYQFQSQEAFTRAFKKRFRVSPAAYRRNRRLTRISSRVTLNPLSKCPLLYPDREQIIIPRPRLGQVGVIQTQIIFTYRSYTSLLERKFDNLYLLFQPR